MFTDLRAPFMGTPTAQHQSHAVLPKVPPLHSRCILVDDLTLTLVAAQL